MSSIFCTAYHLPSRSFDSEKFNEILFDLQEIPLLRLLYSNSDEETENLVNFIWEQEAQATGGAFHLDSNFLAEHEKVGDTFEAKFLHHASTSIFY